VTKPNGNSDEFSNLLVEVIDKTLSSLGEAPKSAIYLHLEKVFNLNRSEIPARIDEFSSGIEDLFGLGARILEIKIIQNLHSEVGVVWGAEASNSRILPDLTFKQYVGLVRKYFEDARRYEDQTSTLMTEEDALEKYR